MIAWSVSDLRRITELSKYSEQELVRIENDELMQKYLYKLGMDCYDYAFIYTANKHRNLAGEVVTGYRVVGELRIDSNFRDSWMAGVTERLIISSYSDPSFMKEIAELAWKQRDFQEYLNDSDSIDYDESRALFHESQLEPDWLEQEAIIDDLNNYLVSVRGSCYNDAGACKTAREYKEWLEGK